MKNYTVPFRLILPLLFFSSAGADTSATDLLDRLVELYSPRESAVLPLNSTAGLRDLETALLELDHEVLKIPGSEAFESLQQQSERLSELFYRFNVEVKKDPALLAGSFAGNAHFYSIISSLQQRLQQTRRKLDWTEKIANMLPAIQLDMACNSMKINCIDLVVAALVRLNNTGQEELNRLTAMLNGVNAVTGSDGEAVWSHFQLHTLHTLKRALTDLTQWLDRSRIAEKAAARLAAKAQELSLQVSLRIDQQEKRDAGYERELARKRYNEGYAAKSNPKKQILYSKALEHDPMDAAAYNNRGITLARQGFYAEALQDYEKAIALKPQFAQAFTNRGNVHFKMGQVQAALSDYRQSLKIDSLYMPGYLNRASLYMSRGLFPQAVADYERVLSCEPERSEIYAQIALSYKHMDDSGRALAYCERAIQREPQRAELYVVRGDIHREFSRYEKAVEDYDRAIRLDPRSARAYDGRGICNRKLRRFERAIRDHNRSIETDPENASAWYNLGCVYWDMKDWNAVIQAWEHCLRLNPDHKTAAEWLAKAKKML